MKRLKTAISMAPLFAESSDCDGSVYAEILCDLVEAQKNIYEAADLTVSELAPASRTDKLKYQDLIAACKTERQS